MARPPPILCKVCAALASMLSKYDVGTRPAPRRERTIMSPARKTAWTNARILTPWESLDAATIIVEGERILDVRQGSWTAEPETAVLDLQNRLVLPGLIDTHVHGSAGHDVMDATPAALAG